eukprot:8176672-Ditylum_brightwellii.AAC.1
MDQTGEKGTRQGTGRSISSSGSRPVETIRDDATTNDIPNMDTMTVADIKPGTDNNHKNINIGIQAEINAINSAKLVDYSNNPGKTIGTMEMQFNHIQYILKESLLTTKQFTIQ